MLASQNIYKTAILAPCNYMLLVYLSDFLFNGVNYIGLIDISSQIAQIMFPVSCSIETRNEKGIRIAVNSEIYLVQKEITKGGHMMYFALYIILSISFNQRQTSIGSLAFLIIFFIPLI